MTHLRQWKSAASMMAAALLAFSCLSQAAENTDKGSDRHHDVRILIDVSGSMKNNDPQNLRRSALRLITELLPEGSKAGVWTFGAYVNMLVPYDTVNKAWKQRAEKSVGDINSFGLSTDIEKALTVSSWDWNKPEADYQRDYILLTDGLVDISSDDRENRSSRFRILNEILPRLQQSGDTIYTIALSDNADTDLLQQLAAASSGWHETVKNANGLERAFFRMFERATQPETLPLKDNTVLVDNSVSEVTFLIFRQPDTPDATILTPSNREYTRDSAPATVKWHSEKNYDLVTVSKPENGHWHINADVDPDNRVMVVTDLKLVSSTLPGSVLTNDNLNMSVHLEQDGKTISKKEFMNFIDMSLAQSGPDGTQRQWTLLDNGLDGDSTAADGLYNHSFAGALTPGQNTVVLSVDGTTFKRERRQFFTVYAQPAIARINPSADGGYDLQVLPIPELVDAQSLAVTATVTADGDVRDYTLTRSDLGAWYLSLTKQSSDSGRVEVHVTGKRQDGRPFESRLDPLNFGEDAAAKPVHNTVAAPETAPVTTDTPATSPAPVSKKIEPEKPGWAFVISQVLLFNVLAGLAVFFIYRKWFKKQSADADPLEELDHA